MRGEKKGTVLGPGCLFFGRKEGEGFLPYRLSLLPMGQLSGPTRQITLLLLGQNSPY